MAYLAGCKGRLIVVLLAVPVIAETIMRLLVYNKGDFRLKIAFILIVGLCYGARYSAKFIYVLFFLVGSLLPLFGLQSYLPSGINFDFLLCLINLLLVVRSFGRGRAKPEALIQVLFIAYIGLAFFSLALLPVNDFILHASLWNPIDFIEYIGHLKPEMMEYSFVAFSRICMFCIAIILINRLEDRQTIYHALFYGIGVSVLWATIVGVLEYAGFVDLSWYRMEYSRIAGESRMQSIFGNPGWFSEYIIVCFPFLLFLFRRKKHRRSCFKLGAIVLFFLCLFLAGSRTAWLLFPFLVIFTYYFFISQRMGEAPALVKRRKIPFSVVLVGIVCIGAVLFLLHGYAFEQEGHKNLSFIKTRAANIVNPNIRMNLWNDTRYILQNNYIWGRGYESYRWQQGVLNSIPASAYSKKKKTAVAWETTHNMYLQILVGTGVIGLAFWIMLFILAAKYLFYAWSLRRSLAGLSVFASLLLYHMYGFTQSMQYIGCIHFVACVGIGYGICCEQVHNEECGHRKFRRGIYAILLLILLVGAIFYRSDFQSHKEAQLYRVPRYMLQDSKNTYIGFYGVEKWGDRYFRWTGKAAHIDLRERGVLNFSFACYSTRLNKQPITMDVYANGKLIDSYVFKKKGIIERTYRLGASYGKSPVSMKIMVSRTWSLKEEGVGRDTRSLGVAVSGPVPKKVIPVPVYQFLFDGR